jgi:hypothetical protein
MGKRKKGYLLAILAVLFLTSLIILSLSSGNVTGAKEPPERFKGYNKERGKWTSGNLGKAYVEGDFVSYQLRIDKSSKVWGATEFSISFNFHQRSSGAIYVDGFDTSEETGFQWSTGDFLPDGQPTPPPGWGTHIPTPEAGEPWISGPKIINYMDAWPPGTGDGTPPGSYPAQERYFTVYGMPWTGDHIILFFRAHLALDIIWSEGLEGDLPTVLDGDEFETWTASWKGASFATGSSRHFYLRYPCVGKKDIPIPIAQYPSTVVNGHKYVNEVLFNGWEINLTGELSLGPSLPPIPYAPPPVYTGTSPWTTGYFEFTGLIEGNYTVQEEDRLGYTHENILTSGDGYVTGIDIPGGWVSFYLPGGGTRTVDFYNSAFLDLTVSKTATPSWEQTFTWTIEKTATPTLSKIFVGDKTDVKYIITVTATPTANVYEVSGTITIDNPNPDGVVYATILDEVWDGAVLEGSQDLTPGGPIPIPSGVSTYDYSITLSDVVVGKTYTNKVTVEVTQPVSRTYYAEETFSFTAPTELVDEEVDVEDSYQGFLGTVHYSDSPETFEYVRTFGPYSAVGSNLIVNAATATGKDTGSVWTDSATVEIQVFDIGVSKTADTYWKRVFNWTVEKVVEAAQLQPFINDQIEVRYTIDVVKAVDTDTFKVNGTITIVNNNPSKSAEVEVVDKIYDGTSVVASQDLGTHTIAPGATLTLDYEIFFTPEIGIEYTNVVHVELENNLWKLDAAQSYLYNTEFTGATFFTFTEPTTIVDDSATVEEVETTPDGFSAVVDWGTQGPPPWTVTDSIAIVFTKNITVVDAEPCNWYDMPNTVTLTESDTGAVRQDSALVSIHVIEPPPPPENPPSFEFKHKTHVKRVQVGLNTTINAVIYNTGLPESRVYYLTFTAVIGNYSLLNFAGPPYIAHIKIYYNDGSVWEADLSGTLTYEKFAGFDIMGDYWMVTWRVPTTYPDGPYLEGNYDGYMDARAEISFQVTGVGEGSTWLVFFPRATEDHHSVGVPLSGVNDKANIWESDGYWYPVHNSYDPYDADIDTGHAFVDLSWEALPTTNEYAWAIRFIDIVTKTS